MGTAEQQGRVLIFTGDGKGKTTAALGMVLRACGHGHRVLVVQFIKNDPTTGEISAIRHLPSVTLVQTGKGFVPKTASPRFVDHVRAAEEGLALAEDALSRGGADLIVLDEVCTAVAKGLVPEERLLALLGRRSRRENVVFTGRGATPALLAVADTVTEMRPIKHAYAEGRSADEGVEF